MTDYPSTVDLNMKDKILGLLQEKSYSRPGIPYVEAALRSTPPAKPEHTKNVAIQALIRAGMRQDAEHVVAWLDFWGRQPFQACPEEPRWKVGWLVDDLENDRDPEYLKVIATREGPYGQEIMMEGDDRGWCASVNFRRRYPRRPKPLHNRTEKQIMAWLRAQNQNEIADRIAAGEYKAGH